MEEKKENIGICKKRKIKAKIQVFKDFNKKYIVCCHGKNIFRII